MISIKDLKADIEGKEILKGVDLEVEAEVLRADRHRVYQVPPRRLYPRG